MIFITLYIKDIDSKMHRRIIVIAFTKAHMCKKSVAMICKIPPVKCKTRYVIYYHTDRRISI